MKNTKKPSTLKDRMNFHAWEWKDFAINLCIGSYQKDVVDGVQRISGSDLKGNARKYSMKYKRSRDAILARMTSAGIPYMIYRYPSTGKLELIIGEKS